MMNSVLYCFLFLPWVIAYRSDFDIKVRFDDRPSRPVTNPAWIKEARRSLPTRRNAFCRTIGSAAGALIAHRLTISGAISNGEQLPGHSLIDLTNFVNLLTASLKSRVASKLKCQKSSLKDAAAEMCNTIICGTAGKEVTRDESLAIALETYGVLGAIPSLEPYTPRINYTKTCNKLYNLRLFPGIDFYRNPEHHSDTLIYGLDTEIFQIGENLKAVRAKPLSLPVVQDQHGHEEYMQAAIHGTVIASHLIKSILDSARMTTVKKPGNYDATNIISRAVCQIIQALRVHNMKLAYRMHNIALKISLYWMINNRDLAEKLSTHDLTLASLDNIRMNFRDKELNTNDSIVHPLGQFFSFNGITYTLDAAAAILTYRITTENINAEIQSLSLEVKTIPDEVIAMEVLPVPGTASAIQHTPDMLAPQTGGVGGMPNASEWFATDAPARNATSNANVVIMGTLAVVLGKHANSVIPKLGLITSHDQPGYRNMSPMCIYTIIKKILQQFITKLMTVMPMSLDTGFYMLNAAFKSAKLALNMVQFQQATPEMMIPLALRHYDLLQFHPQLQHIKWELWPVPPTLQVLHLWVKPNLDVNITEAIDKKIFKITHEAFPAILEDIIEIMKFHLPGLSYFNLKKLTEDTGKLFKWDPPTTMSFLYDPVTADGVVSYNFALVDAPHTPIHCPGHIFCPPYRCPKWGCGFYACDSRNPWCYFPPDIQCPGSISCPVFIENEERTISCPNDKDCPIVDMECPGRSECPDQVTVCPGSASCPLSIKCPGTLCPNRFTTQSHILLPCPLHPLCAHPHGNHILCTNDRSCDANTESAAEIAIKQGAAQIAEVLKNQKPVININNTAVSHVLIQGSEHTAEATATSNVS